VVVDLDELRGGIAGAKVVAPSAQDRSALLTSASISGPAGPETDGGAGEAQRTRVIAFIETRRNSFAIG